MYAREIVGCEWTSETCERAAERGQLACLRYEREKMEEDIYHFIRMLITDNDVFS